MKLKVKGDFFEVEVEGETVQDVWRKAAFWHSLPTTCPVDDKPVRLGFANRGGYDYFYLESTGPKRYRFAFGQSTSEKGGLFPGEYEKKDGETYRRWVYWDGQQEVVMWENGRLLTGQPAQTPAQAPANPLVTQFDQLGMQIYSTNWPEVRKHNIGRVSKNRTEDSAELTPDEMNLLIAGLQRLAIARQKAGK